MLPLAHIKIAAQQGVDVAQHVQVKGSGDAQRIVIRWLQNLDGLDQIYTDQQAATSLALRAQALHTLQEFSGFIRRKVANARARVKRHHGALGNLGVQLGWQLQSV